MSQFIWPPHPVGAAHLVTLTVPGTYLEKQHGRHAWAQTEASDIFPSEIFLDGWFVMKAFTTVIYYPTPFKFAN